MRQRIVAVAATVLALVATSPVFPPGTLRAQGAERPSMRADSILTRAGERYRRIHSFCAHFSQERIVPLLHQTTRSEGELCEMQPAYFAMDFTEPDGDRVVADGRYLWMYYPSMSPDQVMRTRLEGTSGGALDFQREFLEDAENRFRVTYQGRDSVTGRATHALELEPREDRGYRKARVWLEVDRGLIRKVEITEENGSVRRVVLSDIRLNPELEPSHFQFTPPPGTRILDRSGAGVPGRGR